MPVENGNTIKVHYVGTLDDGTEFDNSRKRDAPLEFAVGSGQIIKGFDTAVVGMKKGETKKIKVTPAEGYGEKTDEAIKKVPRDQLPPDQEPKVGMILGLKLPTGQQFPAKILAVTEADVTLDLNHPLAGQHLNFDIEIVEEKVDVPAAAPVEEAVAEEPKSEAPVVEEPKADEKPAEEAPAEEAPAAAEPVAEEPKAEEAKPDADALADELKGESVEKKEE